MIPETRVFQAADSEDSVILACTVLTDPPVWRMDRQTDRIAMAKMRVLTTTCWDAGTVSPFQTDGLIIKEHGLGLALLDTTRG